MVYNIERNSGNKYLKELKEIKNKPKKKLLKRH